jgi:hypothetical protein
MTNDILAAMLAEIVNGETVQIGKTARVYRYSEGGIVARMEGSGLISPEYALRGTGLRLALAWVNNER